MSHNPYASEEAEEYLRLVRAGETPKRAAERVGKKVLTLGRYFHRHGMPEYAAPLYSIYKRSIDPNGNTKPEKWTFTPEGLRIDRS